MTNHGLVGGIISVALRLCRIDDLPQLRFIFLTQLNISRRKILLQSLRLCCSRNSNESLRCYPCKCNLGQSNAFSDCKLLHLLNDLLVMIEVGALEFRRYEKLVVIIMLARSDGTRTSATKVVGRELFRTPVREIIN